MNQQCAQCVCKTKKQLLTKRLKMKAGKCVNALFTWDNLVFFDFKRISKIGLQWTRNSGPAAALPAEPLQNSVLQFVICLHKIAWVCLIPNCIIIVNSLRVS